MKARQSIPAKLRPTVMRSTSPAIRTAISRPLARISLDSGEHKLEILASREDGELTGVTLNKQGTMAPCLEHQGNDRNSFYRSGRKKHLPGLKRPAKLRRNCILARRHELALSASGRPGRYLGDGNDHTEFRQLTFSPHVGVDLKSLVVRNGHLSGP